MLVEWNDEFALGDEVIDAGHRLVIEAINRLNAATTPAESAAVVARMLPALSNHLARQFEHESRLMAHRGHAAAEHEAEHRRLLHVLAVIEQGRDAGAEMSAALLLNLVCFLATHLRGTDGDTFAPALPQRKAA